MMRMEVGLYATRSAPEDDQEASVWACCGFLALNIALASLGAWEKGPVAFALLSLALTSSWFLLSIAFWHPLQLEPGARPDN